jgi:phenylpropionate dioxygenase-like ring-hydroxylating dioxygenase large terminal subunit
LDIIKGTGTDHSLWVRNCWYVAAWCHEVTVHQMHAITIINKPVLIYRKENGELTALADQCCHRQAPLSLGRLEGDDVRCMYHGLKFNADGKCIEIPTMNDIPESFQVPTYPVIERDGWVWVWMGDSEKADPDMIPAATGPDDPDWVMNSGFIDYDASYLLVADNLTDFSHIAWVHENSFAAGSSGAFVAQPRVQMIDRGIKVTRWNTNVPPRGYMDKNKVYDQYITYDFLVPGVLTMFSAMYPGGTAEACDKGHPEDSVEPSTANFTSQAITPMTDGTTRYYFCWGPRAKEHEADPKLLEGMWALANMAFEEDKVMIEAQQRNINLQTGAKMVSITDDRGPTMFRKAVEGLIKEE